MKMKLSILLLFLLSNNILSSESVLQNIAATQLSTEENASMKFVIAKVLTEDQINYLGNENAKKLVESILKTAFPKLRAEQFKESFWSKIKEWLAKVTGNQTSNQKELDKIKKSVTTALEVVKREDVYDPSKITDVNRSAFNDNLAFVIDMIVYEQQKKFLEGIIGGSIIVPNIDTALTDNQKRTNDFLADDSLLEKNLVSSDLAKLNESWATREKVMHVDAHSKAIQSGNWDTFGFKTDGETIQNLTNQKRILDFWAAVREVPRNSQVMTTPNSNTYSRATAAQAHSEPVELRMQSGIQDRVIKETGLPLVETNATRAAKLATTLEHQHSHPETTSLHPITNEKRIPHTTPHPE